MPSRNIVRYDCSDTYYHVYLRGVNKAAIFMTNEDKEYFLFLVSRHLSVEEKKSKNGYMYPHYRGDVELLTYCLMDNHFHLLIYQAEAGALAQFMKSLLTSYTMYFNRTHKRSGPLFGSRFKAATVGEDAYLLHVSRYIHLNPRSWKYYRYSSINHYRRGTEPEWLQTEKVLNLYNDRHEYIQFLLDYEDVHESWQEMKCQLADT